MIYISAIGPPLSNPPFSAARRHAIHGLLGGGGVVLVVHALARVVPLEDHGDVLGDVDPLRVGAHDEVVAEEAGVLGPLRLVLDQARVDEVDELDGEELAVGARVEAGRVAVHHLLQLLEDGVPLGVGEAPGGKLDESDACGGSRQR